MVSLCDSESAVGMLVYPSNIEELENKSRNGKDSELTLFPILHIVTSMMSHASTIKNALEPTQALVVII